MKEYRKERERTKETIEEKRERCEEVNAGMERLEDRREEERKGGGGVKKEGKGMERYEGLIFAVCGSNQLRNE